MTVGLATASFANALLNTVNNTSFSIAQTWIQLHTGDPGASGTANLSAVTTREQATFSAASLGSLALASSPSAWSMIATETIEAISVWSAATSGTFYWSASLAVNKSVANGDTLTLNTCGLSFAPLAA